MMVLIMALYTSQGQRLTFYRTIQLPTLEGVEFILNRVQQIIRFIPTQYLQVIIPDYMFNLQTDLLLEIILFPVQEIMVLKFQVQTVV